MVVGISSYRVTRRCCEGGILLSSKACGIPPCNTPTRIIDSSWGHGKSARNFLSVRIARRFTYVVCGVRVLVNPAKKCSRGIFTDLLRQQIATTGMLVEERPDVVNETGYEDQGPRLRLFLDYDTVYGVNTNALHEGGGAKNSQL
jgi:hypothetical protein